MRSDTRLIQIQIRKQRVVLHGAKWSQEVFVFFGQGQVFEPEKEQFISP